MITQDLSNRIKKVAEKYNSIEDFLLWVNDQCEWYDITGERFEYTIKFAKKCYKHVHGETIKVKCEKTDEKKLRYFRIYELRGLTNDGERVTLDRYMSESKAEQARDIYYDTQMYDSLWIMQEQVWVD